MLRAQDSSVLWAEDAANLEGGDLSVALRVAASSIASRLRGQLIPAERARLERRGFTSADPGFADAWAGLALAQHGRFWVGRAAREQLLNAKEQALRALAIDPDNVLALHALVRMYHSTGQDEDAVRYAQRVLQMNAQDPDAQLAAALAYFRAAMLDRAMDLYEQYLTAHPEDEDSRGQFINACLFAGAYARGMRHAQPLLASQRPFFTVILLHANSGDLARAVPMARQSLATEQRHTASAYFMPLVLKAAGLHREARSAWLRSAALMEAQLSRADTSELACFWR